jgi:hypothetical protein
MEMVYWVLGDATMSTRMLFVIALFLVLVFGCGAPMEDGGSKGDKTHTSFRMRDYPCKDGQIRKFIDFKNSTEQEVTSVISRYPDIASIFLRETRLSARLVDALAHAPHLEALLFNGEIPDITALSNSGRVISLTIRSDDELCGKGLGRFHSLRWLYLEGKCSEDRLMKEISELKNLESISLLDSKVTIVGLRQLSQMPNLRIIDGDPLGGGDDDEARVIEAMLPANQDAYGYIGAYLEEFGDLGPYKDGIWIGVTDWKAQWSSMSKEERKASEIGLVKIDND